MNKNRITTIGCSIPILSYLYNQNNKLNELIDSSTKHHLKNTEKNMDNSYKKILKHDVSGRTILSVSKKISTHWDKENINVYENEKKWLNILKDTNIIAKPIYFDDKTRTITTEYAGERINKHNLPENWEEQRDNIINVLEKYNCRHNDIKPEEVIIYNGKIKLIDFGWANDLNTVNPKNFPPGLGAKFKCNKKNKEFVDKCSFNKSIYFIKYGKLL